MTTFVERCIGVGDFDLDSPGYDGGQIDLILLESSLVLYATDVVNAAWIKSRFTCSSGQENELDEILATKPGGLVALLARSNWATQVCAILNAGLYNQTGFSGASACRGQLGL